MNSWDALMKQLGELPACEPDAQLDRRIHLAARRALAAKPQRASGGLRVFWQRFAEPSLAFGSAAWVITWTALRVLETMM